MKLATILFWFIPSFLYAESYWQQNVHYKIDATLNTKNHHIEGKEQLIYTNNSPDTLEKVYFRLYWNLFTEGSRGQKVTERFKWYGSDTTGGIWLKKFAIVQNDLELTPNYSIDNTLMEIHLIKPLFPGDSIVFRCEFEERVPEEGARTGHQGRDYNIAQWYPQIATYDKYGWDKSQYLGLAEFHNEFGAFDVTVTIPKSFTLGYSGVLLNPEEVYSDSVLQRLRESVNSNATVRIADYSNQDWSGKDTELVTWKFHADHVRDFAWAANEHYIWDVEYWKPDSSSSPIASHALYFTDKAEFWKEVAHFGTHAISFFSEHYGLYMYPSMFVVEGVVGGGMEYPGIVFIGHYGDKNGHGLFGVVTHEIGHNWYPMMIGSNETYFAFMDEGFNVFITSTAYEHYYGRYNNTFEWTEWYQHLLHFPNDDERDGIQRQSLYLAKTGYEEPIATHSYRFTEPGLAGVSIYPKTASVMYMLQYVLGDSAFEKVMKEYYHRWKFKHPYPEDFYATAQEVSGQRDLRWFFDEWFHRTYTCDYAMGGLKYYTESQGNQTIYRTKVNIKRYREAIMPVDVRIGMENGRDTTVWFPADRWFNAEISNDTVIDLPSRPVRAELNPDGRILDINRLNNRTGLAKTEFRLDNTMFNTTPIDAYLVKWRPSIWFTDRGGWNFGYKFSGSYLDDLYAVTLYDLYNVRDKTLDYDLSFYHNTFFVSPLSSASVRGYRLEGRKGLNLTFQKEIRQHHSYPPYHTIRLQYSFSKADDANYLFAPFTWQYGNLHRMLVSYTYFNRGKYGNFSASANIEASTSLFGRSDYIYTKRTYEMKTTLELPIDGQFSLRLVDGVGYGQIPNQTKYYFAGASPLEQFSTPLYRSRGVLPKKVGEHTLYAGGANMRGYFDSFAFGDKIEAINAEIKFTSFFPLMNLDIPVINELTQHFHSALFFDAGRIANDPQSLWDQRFEVDFGFGFRLNSFYGLLGQVSQSNLLSGIGLNSLRIDFPIYVSKPLPGDNHLKFRWIVSFSQVF